MSNKPRKHSELKRSRESSASRMKCRWGTPRATAPAIPINPERHLIVTEGEKTEPYYFEAIKRRINDRYHRVWVSVEVEGEGLNTLALLERAREIARDDAEGFTHVWVVYDKDSFSAEDFNAVVERCEGEDIGGEEYHAVWSNECFELWYIEHFEFMQSALPRMMYEPKLTEHLTTIGKGGYAKNREDMFEVLESRLDTAIENARKLEVLNVDRTPAESNPGTNVHVLVERLRPFFSKDGGDGGHRKETNPR